jgi:hypothetical protein
MQKKKYWMVLGAVVVMLIVSNASALPTIQSNKSNYRTTDVKVDPNICITKEKLPLLKIAFQHIDDPDYKIFVTEMIKIIEKNGKGTSNDCLQIVNQYHLNIDRISAGFVWAYGNGPDSVIPGELFKDAFGFYFGPVIVGFWSYGYSGDLKTSASYRINFGPTIYKPNNGLVIGGWSFFGFLLPGFGWSIGGGDFTQSAGGLYTLIVISFK